jgi:hypothetical protein
MCNRRDSQPGRTIDTRRRERRPARTGVLAVDAFHLRNRYRQRRPDAVICVTFLCPAIGYGHRF